MTYYARSIHYNAPTPSYGASAPTYPLPEQKTPNELYILSKSSYSPLK